MRLRFGGLIFGRAYFFFFFFGGGRLLSEFYGIPFDVFGGIFAQANDSYTFTFITYKFHITMSSFSYIVHLLDSNLSTG